MRAGYSCGLVAGETVYHDGAVVAVDSAQKVSLATYRWGSLSVHPNTDPHTNLYAPNTGPLTKSIRSDDLGCGFGWHIPSIIRCMQFMLFGGM